MRARRCSVRSSPAFKGVLWYKGRVLWTISFRDKEAKAKRSTLLLRDRGCRAGWGGLSGPQLGWHERVGRGGPLPVAHQGSREALAGPLGEGHLSQCSLSLPSLQRRGGSCSPTAQLSFTVAQPQEPNRGPPGPEPGGRCFAHRGGGGFEEATSLFLWTSGKWREPQEPGGQAEAALEEKESETKSGSG